MSGALGPKARVLCGVMARAMGWRPAEFWEATPAEIAAILPEPEAGAAMPLTRAEMNRMMEREHDDKHGGRCGG